MKESVREEIEKIIRERYGFLLPTPEEYRDNGLYSVGWLCMIADYDLSEDLLREFKNSFSIEAHWAVVCRYQNLSKEFIYEMEDYLDMEKLIERGLISRGGHGNCAEEVSDPILNRFEILDLRGHK